MNNETPELNSKSENPYLKNTSEELTTQLVQLKEALASEAGKDINATDILGLVPIVSKNEEVKPTISAEEVQRLQEVRAFATERLAEAGITTDAPVVSKMSAIEQQLSEKQEKMALAKFGEQITELTALDENLDVELVKSLNMATEDKVIVASLVKNIASKYTTAISKMTSELESANKQAEINASFSSPKEESDGQSKVKDTLAKFGLELPAKDLKETK